MSKKKNTKKRKNCTRNLEKEKSAKTMKNKEEKELYYELEEEEEHKEYEERNDLGKSNDRVAGNN